MKNGDKVVAHYCGGSVYGFVISHTAKSVRIRKADGQTATYRRDRVRVLCANSKQTS